jgi:SAM-dependent methyltransferase
MNEADLYTPAFYAAQRRWARRSAREIVPLVLADLPVRSVCDVGCGVGAWLSVFAEHGIDDVIGVDGAYAAEADLLIPRDRFVPRDLKSGVDLERSFDLALCLEVAEHLPERHAGPLIDSLVELAPAVLFSAAIPHQGGHGHVNERWQSWWAGLFAAHDYAPVDLVRPRIWRNPRVNSWYKQNLLLYVRRDELAALPPGRFTPAPIEGLDLVHPDHYMKYVTGELTDFRRLLRRLPERIGRRLGLAPRA